MNKARSSRQQQGHRRFRLDGMPKFFPGVSVTLLFADSRSPLHELAFIPEQYSHKPDARQTPHPDHDVTHAEKGSTEANALSS